MTGVQTCALPISIVFVTSFNEWHEGTEIAPSLQYGTKYLDLTKSISVEFQDAWAKATEVREMIGIPSALDLGFVDDTSVDVWLGKLVSRARSHVETFLNKTYTPATLPEGVKECTLRLTSKRMRVLPGSGEERRGRYACHCPG